MCVLLGYGADAICPYLVFETMSTLRSEGVINSSMSEADIFKVKRTARMKFVLCFIISLLCSLFTMYAYSYFTKFTYQILITCEKSSN